MFGCFECGTLAVLYQGYCEECRPELHAAWKRDVAEWSVIFTRYERETGMAVLSDWLAFERWLEQVQGV